MDKYLSVTAITKYIKYKFDKDHIYLMSLLKVKFQTLKDIQVVIFILH
ncbi:hypothetical protein ACM3BO_07975 [Mammaliicoccus sciuri]